MESQWPYSNESVYNLVQEPAQKLQRPPAHVSRFPGTLAPTGSTFNVAQTNRPGVSNLGGESICKDYGGHAYGKKAGSFGPNYTKNGGGGGGGGTGPADYLKASSKPVASLYRLKKNNPDVLKPTVVKERFKPSLPSKEDKPVTGLVTSKNFIVANAVENILAAPKRRVETDDDFMNKDDFGKVPSYLGKIKADINAEYDYIRDLKNQQQEASRTTRVMTGEEKQQMIHALKSKWEEVNSEYQLGTHLTKLDTVGKIARKESQESKLIEIEAAIEKLKRDNIVVDQNS